MRTRWVFLALLAAALRHAGAAAPAPVEQGTNVFFSGPVIAPLAYPPAEALTSAAKELLARERRTFAAELRRLPRYRPNDFQTTSRVYELVPAMDESEVDAIIARMQDGALNTPRDNNARFRRALAERIPVFGRALKRFAAGEYMRALDTAVALTKEKILLVKRGYAFDTMPPYCYCTVKLFQAEAFGLAGAGKHCLVAYQIAYNKLPLSVSFAPTARIRAADLYARTDRGHYALLLNQAVLEQHARNLSHTELLRLRVQALRWMREDPFRLGLRLAGDVTRRLDAPALGPVTQTRQELLLARMEDMMMGTEQDDNFFGENTMRLAGKPIDGAALKKGVRTEQFFFTNDVAVVGTDEWGELRPREKQELIQMLGENYSQRYRDMLEAYYRRLSIEESRQEDSLNE